MHEQGVDHAARWAAGPRAAAQGAPGPLKYRARDPAKSPLYKLIDKHYDTVKGSWEELYEHRYGFWRGFVDAAIRRFQDCGFYEHGFARVRCDACQHEFIVAFSCKGRQLCPACGAKRAAAFAAFLHDEVLEEVDHDQWVFSIPKMLRPYFFHHRHLLGDLCRLAYETVRELMTACLPDDDDTFRPGMVAVIQTFGSKLNLNPHVHAIVSRGGWLSDGRFVSVSHVDTHTAEILFRHKVLALLKRHDLIDEDRIGVMLSWHHSGFSVHNKVGIDRDDGPAIERLARYVMRSPVSLERIHYDEDAEKVTYALKGGRPARNAHDADEPDTVAEETLDAREFVARVLVHIPEPRLHLAHYFGAYSSVLRARRRKTEPPAAPDDPPDIPPPSARRRLWADLIRRVYEVDPLVCTRCGSTMRVIAFITDPKTIRKILAHLAQQASRKRGPPHAQ